MTYLQTAPDRRDFKLLIRPNSSLSAVAAIMIFAVFCVVAVGIGIYMVMLGAWPVLPFLGLELALLAITFVLFKKRSTFFDLIVSEGDRVQLKKKDRSGERELKLHRYWAQIRVSTGPSWYPSKMWIGSHGKFTEIGAVLTEEDRLKTAKQLRSLLRA